MESYKASKKKILDIVTQGLKLSCVNPIRKSKATPNRKSQRLRREIQDVDGNGGQILPTLRNDIVRFQSDTVEEMKNGLGAVFDGNWSGDLGSLLYLFLWDLWILAIRNYFGSLRKENSQEGKPMRVTQLKGK